MADVRLSTWLAVGGILLALSGCFSPAGGRASAGPVTGAQVLPLSGLNHRTERIGALRFELPTDAGYQPEQIPAQTSDPGTGTPTWRAPSTDGSCIVIAGQQPNFAGTFPASAIAAFAASGEPGGEVEVNSMIDPAPGTVAGVEQSSRYPLRSDGIDVVQGFLAVRQYLTEDGTLISLSAAGPANAIESCRLAEITTTLRSVGG